MTPACALRAPLFALAAGGLALAAAWAVRFAQADAWARKETVEATEKAIALAPEQAEYHVRLAWLIGDRDPPGARAELRRAVALNPNDGRAWVELGLRLEAAGDLAGAEQTLLRAARQDHTYLPRWTLLNYYFRRRDADRFWTWAKATVPMIYGDPVPLFQLCGRTSEDGALLNRLDIRNPQLQAAYLFYLLDRGHAALAGPAARRLLRDCPAKDLSLLWEACDRLIEAGRAEDATAIWDVLAHPPPGGDRISDGGFTASPRGHGFGWRLPVLGGIAAARPPGGGLRLSFSGTEDEAAEPLLQYVAVPPGAACELRFACRTSGLAAPSGLFWRIADLHGKVLLDGPDLAPDGPADGRLAFRTPADCRIVRLSLVYRRRPGTTRIQGRILLRKVECRQVAGARVE